MINILDKQQCCGCGACAQVCPTHCITMVPDDEGFVYPSADPAACVHCDRCEKVCPILRADSGAVPAQGVLTEPLAVGGRHRDEAVRLASSSGGAFSLLAGHVLKRGGEVYGAAFVGRSVQHVCARSEEEIGPMRGSKYVQSEIGDTYTSVRRALKEGRPVLFTGTPCQTAGLLSFLGQKPKDLFLVDFICHGVPSPMVFSQYLDSIERREHSKVVSFSFREKDRGWHASGLQMGTRVRLEDGREIRKAPALKDTYMNGFLEDIYLRPSCYRCRFKTIPKWSADITIADFWGIDRVMPQMNDGRGTSLLLIHSEQGQKLFDAVKDGFEYEECDWKAATVKNPTLVRSAEPSELREPFFDDLKNVGYDRAAAKHLSTGKTFLRKGSRIAGNKFIGVIRGALNAAARVLHIDMTPQMQDRLVQFIKFCMVGLTNTAVSYLVNICTLFLLSRIAPGFRYDYVIANVTAFLVSVYWSFYWNSRKVFHLSTKDRALRRRALLKTYMCYALTGILLNNVLSTLWIRVLGISKYVAPLINLAITIPVNYLTNKYWAFAQKPEKPSGEHRNDPDPSGDE